MSAANPPISFRARLCPTASDVYPPGLVMYPPGANLLTSRLTGSVAPRVGANLGENAPRQKVWPNVKRFVSGTICSYP